MLPIKEAVLNFERVHGGGVKHIPLRRAANEILLRAGAKFTSAGINPDENTATVELILSESDGTPEKSTEEYRKFVKYLNGKRHLFQKLLGTAQSGQRVPGHVMNFVLYTGRSPTLNFLYNTKMENVKPMRENNYKVYKPVEKTGRSNLQNKNGSNQYNIFDSQPPLREFVLGHVKKEIDKKKKYIIVDPCAGLGRLTPTTNDVGQNCRIQAYDLVVPTKRQELYGNFQECRDICRRGAIQWSSLIQPGVDVIHEQDFFEATANTYNIKPSENLIFVMNPPFTIPKSKKRTKRGVVEFVKQCCEISKEAKKTATVFTVCQRGLVDAVKENIHTLPDNVEIEHCWQFYQGKDDRTYFMRIVDCDPNDETCKGRWDMISTDIALLKLKIHPSNYSRKGVMRETLKEFPFARGYFDQKPSERTSLMKKAMLDRYRFYIGASVFNPPPRWVDQTKDNRTCPDIVRSFSNKEKLGEIWRGCPNNSSIHTENANEKALYTTLGWKIIPEFKKKNRKSKKMWRQVGYKDKEGEFTQVG